MPKCWAWTRNPSLHVLATTTDSNGTRHYRYQQTFRGVPVFGEHVIVSEDKARQRCATCSAVRSTGLAGELPTAPPKVTKGQALSIAKTRGAGQPLARDADANEKTRAR